MKKYTVVMEFPSEESFEEFWGWWLDGGGDDIFYDVLEMRGKEPIGSKSWSRGETSGTIELG